MTSVLHGAVRLQGFTSSPTPDTQVRVACADADGAKARPATTMDAKATNMRKSMKSAPKESGARRPRPES
ncbi:hypothetical protein ACFSCV_15700 [Methylopila henanensis]|uniref:Uncharacterized protein n=1 Tax=Methylopila henanensis TaxID=873516 RepID=A0ABW4K9G2_9HYPH